MTLMIALPTMHRVKAELDEPVALLQHLENAYTSDVEEHRITFRSFLV